VRWRIAFSPLSPMTFFSRPAFLFPATRVDGRWWQFSPGLVIRRAGRGSCLLQTFSCSDSDMLTMGGIRPLAGYLPTCGGCDFV